MIIELGLSGMVGGWGSTGDSGGLCVVRTRTKGEGDQQERPLINARAEQLVCGSASEGSDGRVDLSLSCIFHPKHRAPPDFKQRSVERKSVH